MSYKLVFSDNQNREKFNQLISLALKNKLFYYEGGLQLELSSSLNCPKEYNLSRFIILATLNGIPVGITWVRTHGILVDKIFEIMFYVKPSHRRMGLASKMFNKLKRETKIKNKQLYNPGSILKNGNNFLIKNKIKIFDGGMFLLSEKDLRIIYNNPSKLHEIIENIFNRS